MHVAVEFTYVLQNCAVGSQKSSKRTRICITGLGEPGTGCKRDLILAVLELAAVQMTELTL
jgi:hypothetical protein